MSLTLLNAEAYTSVEAYRNDLNAIFEKEWLLVGHSTTVPSSHITVRQIGPWQVLLARDPQGVVRAFHNVCRHRAGPLAWTGTEAVACHTIRCRYHAWNYRWDGTLKATPGFGEELPLEELSLYPIRCTEHQGLIWVHLEKGQEGCLLENKAEVVSVLERLSDFELHSQVSHVLKCSWKVYVENYLEGYHIPAMHPKLLKTVKMSSYRVVVHNGYMTHHVDLKSESVHDGFWAFIWPNTAINIYGQGASIERIVPVSETETRIEYQYLFLPNVSSSHKAETIAESELLTIEDRKICEAVHQNLMSGVYTQGYLAPKHECGVLAFQRWVKEAHRLLESSEC